MSALDTQIGGDHYKDMAIQPAEYIVKNGLGFLEGMVIKYVSRWEKKGGIEDLEKAIHCLQLLVEMKRPAGNRMTLEEAMRQSKYSPGAIPGGTGAAAWGGLGE